jgi:DNA topoisomerase-1
MTPEKARELLAAAADDGRVLGRDPLSGNEIVAKAGRYGPYVTEVLPEADEAPAAGRGKAKAAKAAKPKPRTASLFKDMDLASMDLETALKLLSLPRVVGVADDGEEITAQNGRYGPYLKKGVDSRSLATESQLFDITLPEALAIYAEPKQRGRAAAKPPMAEFEPDPVSGKKVTIKDGRFGPYVTDGETNVTVPRGEDPEKVTAERAYELLADKRAKGPTTRKRAVKKTATKKTTARKTTARKTTAKTAAKKTAAKKTAAKKSGS